MSIPLAGICGLILVLAAYELATGRIPGNPVERGVWGYRWVTTPGRLRLASLAGVLVDVGFLILFRPFTMVDGVGGAVGVLLGGLVVVSDARSRRSPTVRTPFADRDIFPDASSPRHAGRPPKVGD